MRFVSEYLQDKWLAEEIFPDKHDGIFVEAGALDGLLHSNTLFLEYERGWTGLLIEAHDKAYQSLISNRPHCACLNRALWSESGMDVSFLSIDSGLVGWSGIEETIEPQHHERIGKHVSPAMQRTCKVETITLSDAVKGYPGIDYLSLDIEGAEYRVLSAYDWSVPIDVIGVEVNWSNPELAKLLRDKGYEFLRRIGPDDFWRRRDAMAVAD
jgi:FkbM family methyltransferase